MIGLLDYYRLLDWTIILFILLYDCNVIRLLDYYKTVDVIGLLDCYKTIIWYWATTIMWLDYRITVLF